MVASFLLLLLPIAALSSWYIGYKKKFPQEPSKNLKFPPDYFVGLNYLINEQPDKAVDVFIKMLEVNSDTFETHLALGSLFRRRGEVDRAIRIHQHLIARPQLNKQQRIQALSELGQDYFRAGVLDRSERLFLELLEMKENVVSSLQYLLNIYQQQKDWEQAILIAKKIAEVTNKSMQKVIAHYYCELAEKFWEKKHVNQAREYLKEALITDNNCVRASLLQAELEMATAQWRTAIRNYKKVEQQDPDYISEIIIPLAQCHENLNLQNEFIEYLEKCLKNYPRVSIVITLADYLRKQKGTHAAIEFMAKQIHNSPSLRGVKYLIKIYLENSQGETQNKLFILHNMIENLLANKPIYRCGDCGFAARTLYWHCPQCREWGKVKPIHGLEGD